MHSVSKNVYKPNELVFIGFGFIWKAFHVGKHKKGERVGGRVLICHSAFGEAGLRQSVFNQPSGGGGTSAGGATAGTGMTNEITLPVFLVPSLYTHVMVQ
jgi:hypothetical protein